MKNPSHPGELVKANLDELGMSLADAAKLLGITHQQLCDVVNGESAVTPELAIRFEKAFRGSASMWLRSASLISVNICYNLALPPYLCYIPII